MPAKSLRLADPASLWPRRPRPRRRLPRTPPNPVRSRKSRAPPPRRASSRPGCRICRPPRAWSPRAPFCIAFPARRVSWSTRRPPMPTAARWRLLRRACACSPSAARRRAATSCCWRSPTSRASRSSSSLKAATAALADPRKTDAAAAEQLIAGGAPDLLLQRRAALGRDRLDRVGAGAGLSPGGVRAADDPPHPRESGGAHQSRSPTRMAATSRWSGSTAT